MQGVAQKNEFIVEGRFKIDGGSVGGAKILVDKDGQQVKSIEGNSKFEVGLDFQAIYVISFVKEGFVTKRLRFDTHVAIDRVDYGFEPFGFSVELFEQYDDVNMIVFNQPVGKISYSELIDEFDYDTDYTKSIQTQINQAMDEADAAKVKKIEKDASSAKEFANLTRSAEKKTKSGNYTAAISNLEEALKLKKDPIIEKRIQEIKQEAKREAEAAAEEKAAAKAAKEAEEKAAAEAKAKLEADTKAMEEAQAKTDEEERKSLATAIQDSKTSDEEAARLAQEKEEALAKAEEDLKAKAALDAELTVKKNSEKSKQSALAFTEQGGRESEQLAKIIEEEEKKSETANIIEQNNTSVSTEQRPRSPFGLIIMSDPKVGEEARKTKTAQLTEDEKFDGQMKRTEAQQHEFFEDQRQLQLKEKYKTRKTVETEKAGTSLITWIYMNTGRFVKTYKKVLHNWGGIYFFIDGRATNRRFWEHETQ